ncbi:molybdopterin-dependent oxidoreductase [Euzebya tangerina]|uniref:molybdopterin-dependent oxidoreductase n=1 Tax=Euzebya tangerina TaxID=591198 RepID=UPI000E31BB23|nr:molybdopterin-dependent oxidoreductase [Euzebya tangerina]
MPTKNSDRLPPGQYEARGWPVLNFGRTPSVDEQTATVRVWGAVEQERRWTIAEFKALPTVTRTADFHCVTKFSVFDNEWFGVAPRTVFDEVGLQPDASHVMLHGAEGYTTNVPLSALLDDDVVFAWRRNGEDISVEHGWPLRLILPKRYAWKSCKWLTGVEVMTADRRGFWEERGYHNDADPFTEQRYSYQE